MLSKTARKMSHQRGMGIILHRPDHDINDVISHNINDSVTTLLLNGICAWQHQKSKKQNST